MIHSLIQLLLPKGSHAMQLSELTRLAHSFLNNTIWVLYFVQGVTSLLSFTRNSSSRVLGSSARGATYCPILRFLVFLSIRVFLTVPCGGCLYCFGKIEESMYLSWQCFGVSMTHGSQSRSQPPTRRALRRIVLGDSDRSQVIRTKRYIESSKNSEKITKNLKKCGHPHLCITCLKISLSTLNIKRKHKYTRRW